MHTYCIVYIDGCVVIIYIGHVHTIQQINLCMLSLAERALLDNEYNYLDLV